MSLRSHALSEFWDYYDALPANVKQQADKQYALLAANPNHPALRFKSVGPYWSVRISRGYRPLARRRGDQLFWFWIGSHDQYERLLVG